MFHLGWFVGRGYSVHAWNQPWSGSIGSDWPTGELLIDLAPRSLQASVPRQVGGAVIRPLIDTKAVEKVEEVGSTARCRR